MRYSSDYRSASRETYNKFCKEYPLIKISFDKYKEIIYTHNGLFMQYALDTGELVSFPRGMGKLGVNRKKTKTLFTDKDGVDHILLPVNWVETKKQGKKVHFFNDHSDGWRGNWIWLKDSTTNMRMKDIWCFKPAREWKLALRDKFKEPGKHFYNYTEWDLGRRKNKS